MYCTVRFGWYGDRVAVHVMWQYNVLMNSTGTVFYVSYYTILSTVQWLLRHELYSVY